MPITINTNISAMISQRNLGVSSDRSASSLAKLSSGSRVPSARDDAASLSIGTGLRRDVSALRAAQVNAQQATSVLQIADGAFSQISDILVRMKSLATTAQSEQLSATELGFLNTEFGELVLEIDRIAGTTEFNGAKLLGGANTVAIDDGFGTVTGNDVTAGAIASNAGFVAYDFDTNAGVAAGDFFRVGYVAASNELTVAGLAAAGGAINNAQTLTVAAPGAGETATYNFSDIGVSITLNSDFDDATDINAGLAAGPTFEIEVAAGASTTQADLDFQVGTGNSLTDTDNAINVQISLGNYTDLVQTQLGAVAITDVNSQAAAQTSTDQVDAAIQSVNTARADLGAKMNRLGFANSNLSVTIENTEAARSVLMDVDVSAEMTTFTSQQVLIQAGVSMLAQANQQPSLLLRLLQ